MTDSKPFPIVLHADEEHGGLRTAVVIILVVAILFIFLLLNGIWPLIAPTALVDFSFVITCTSAIILGVVAAWGIEKGLKQIWHSGRSLTLDDTGILVQDEASTFRLNWDGRKNLLNWRFILHGYKRGGRERRVPEKWVCLSTQLQEGENRIVVYCYAPPKKAELFLSENGRDPYYEIHPAGVFAAAMDTGLLSMPSRPSKIPSEFITGRDGHYWLAEQNRWQEGFELSLSNYETFINSLVNFK